jgi:hypothetical protein
MLRRHLRLSSCTFDVTTYFRGVKKSEQALVPAKCCVRGKGNTSGTENWEKEEKARARASDGERVCEREGARGRVGELYPALHSDVSPTGVGGKKQLTYVELSSVGVYV